MPIKFNLANNNDSMYQSTPEETLVHRFNQTSRSTMFKDAQSKDKLAIGAMEEKLPKLAEERIKRINKKLN